MYVIDWAREVNLKRKQRKKENGPRLLGKGLEDTELQSYIWALGFLSN